MAILRGPFHSDDASGKFANCMVASKWKGRSYMRALVTPNNPKTAQQVAIRDLITDASVAWKLGSTVGGIVIDAGYKAAYEALATPMQISGFDLYIKDTVALNWVGTPKTYDGTLEITDIDP